MSEKDIEDAIIDLYAANSEFTNSSHIASQVYVDGKRIDIVRVRKDYSCVESIEVKIKDWKGALGQAILNKHLTDRSFVAICKQYSKPALKNMDIFIENNIGLMVIDDDFELRTIYQPAIKDVEYEEYDARNYTIRRAVAA
jgi:hypothetical protein